MSQAALRRHTTFYAAVLVCIDLFMVAYISHGADRNIQYEFNKEMLLRVSYISAMAEWAPVGSLMTSTALEAISENAPFRVSVAEATAPEEAEAPLTLSSSFPIAVTKYSPVLKARITLTEGEMTRPSMGCTEEFMATGLCLALCVPLLLFATLGLANLIAHGGQRRLASAVVWVGYLFLPCAISVLMLTVLTVIQRKSENNVWSEDVHRSAVLYSTMFNVIHTMVATENTNLVVKTLTRLNELVLPDAGVYQVCLAVGPQHTVEPPLYSSAVRDALLAHADSSHVNFQGHTDGYIYAASPMPLLSSLIIVLRYEGKNPSVLNTAYLPGLLALLSATVFFGILLLVFVFPYGALGHCGPFPGGTSPWSGRLSTVWPYVKVLEVALAVGVCLAVFSLSLARISRHYYRIEVLKDYYENRIDVIQGVQTVSNSLAQCYTGILGAGDWNADFAEYTTKSISVTDYLSMAQFYRRLSRSLAEMQLYMYSLNDYLMEQPVDRWPYLSNMPFFSVWLPFAYLTPDGVTITNMVEEYNCEFLMAVLENNINFLSEGNSTTILGILMVVQPADLITTDEILSDYVTSVSAQEPYTTRAMAYDSQNVTPETFKAYFDSPLGRLVASIEEDVSTYEKDHVPPCRYFDLSYPWANFTSFYVLYAFSGFALLVWILDLLYTARFFGGAEWRWLRSTTSSVGREGSSVLLETGDYTAPRSVMPVNMHGIRHSLGRLVASFAVVVALTAVFGAVIQSSAMKAVTSMVAAAGYYQKTVVPLSERVQAGALIEMGLAAWARSYLSLQDSHILLAIDMTNTWSSMRSVEWVGGDAVRDPSTMSSSTITTLLSTVQQIAIQTSLFRSELSVEKIYADFASLLDKDQLFFPGYASCLDAVQLTQFWTQSVKGYLLCLIEDNYECAVGSIQILIAISNICVGQGTPADFGAYVNRLAALRFRNSMLVNHQKVSQLMNAITDLTEREVGDMVDLFQRQTLDVRGIDSVTLPWMILLYGWMTCPAVLFVWKYAKQLFFAIYFN